MSPVKWMVLALGLVVSAGTAGAAPRDGLWRQTEAAMSNGLPRTALTNLDSILSGALADKTYPEAVKAMSLRAELESRGERDWDARRIILLQNAMSNAPVGTQPILRTILAHYYWQYFNNHRWQAAQRTATDAAPGNDFTTWDLSRLYDEVGRQFELSLSHADALKKIPIQDWDGLLERGNTPDAWRPTLYDFMANEAIGFYQVNGRPIDPEDKFEIQTNAPLFGDVDTFLRWRPQTSDTNSPLLKAIQLQQDVLRFHRHDPTPAEALAWADLGRIKWVWEQSGSGITNEYIKALDQFRSAHADSPIAASAYALEARFFANSGENKIRGHELAEEAIKRYPDSLGANDCRNTLIQLEGKRAQVSMEHVWNDPWPKIKVTYQNIDSLKFEAIPADWATFIDRENQGDNFTDEVRTNISRMTPALTWTAALPSRHDYTETNTEIPTPKTLKPGFYYLAAFHESGNKRDSDISLTTFWVSDLALVTRQDGGKLDGFVTDARTGEPIAGAEVSSWHLDKDQKRVADPPLTTDTNGYFSVGSSDELQRVFYTRWRGQQIASTGRLQAFRPDTSEVTEPRRVLLFTDRAIYRPGQTIQYKGIVILSDDAKARYEVVKDKEVTVIFLDVNNKEVARQTLHANGFGSFAGSFTTPRDRLMGEMRLRADHLDGQTLFRVEEYKRPKFMVTLGPPKAPPRFNDNVELVGRATSYTGAAIDGAKLTYHVQRSVRLPIWNEWQFMNLNRGQQEIAHGNAVSAADGTFQIQFPATADRNVPESSEAVFDFNVNVDVTDSSGETRSAENIVHVGFAALAAEVDADDWQTPARPVALRIGTKSLDDEPEPANGKVTISELLPPPTIEEPYSGGYYPVNQITDSGDENVFTSWAVGKTISVKTFKTGDDGKGVVDVPLAAGIYRARLETKDRFGKEVIAERRFKVLDPEASKLGLKVSHVLEAPKWEAQPGDDFTALWGTGYPQGRACVEIEVGGKIVRRYWTSAGRTQEQIHVRVTEEMRGGFTLHLTQVVNNHVWTPSRRVQVPWNNKQLTIRWEHFTSKLQPGQNETWTAVVSGPKAEKATAEVMATLYDESLDAFAPLEWDQISNIFHQDSWDIQSFSANGTIRTGLNFMPWEPTPTSVVVYYRRFPPEMNLQTAIQGEQADIVGLGGVESLNAVGYINVSVAGGMVVGRALPNSSGIAMKSDLMAAVPAPSVAPAGLWNREHKEEPKVNLDQVVARKNLNETAFFYPQITADSNGEFRLTFTMHDALTKWHFMALAHDASLRSGFIEAHAVTAKDLMIQPNTPRFVREGDTIEFSVKVMNQSDARQTGTVRVNFNDAATEKNMDAALENGSPEQTFDVPAKESRSYSWRIHVPDGCGFLTYKAVGATDKLSDGQEEAIPVLSRRVLVTESMPLSVRGPATNQFHFEKLLNSGGSKTLQNESLTVQMVSNPAWYAVMALPYLMEFPHECNEQTFNRLYANALARKIANSDPKIRRIFDLWRNTPALDSPLEKNQDLKSVMVEETPWLRDAEKESQSRRNVGILFDNNRMDSEITALTLKLRQAQLSDGRWPWFPGGRGDDFITLYILTGFGRLRHLGVEVSSPIRRSMQTMDDWLAREVREIRKSQNAENYAPSYMDCLYLYCRSFFLKDVPINAAHRDSAEFMIGQARKFCLKTNCRQSQGQLALALTRWGENENAAAARAIMKSLKERSVTSDKMGMHWNDEPSWWWWEAPIETQAIMIEAFDEVAHDAAAVDACQVWLLKQKQTENWKTTKATADAVYAILLRGSDLLSTDWLTRTTVGGVDITPAVNSAESGTGFYEHKFAAGEIRPGLGDITVAKGNSGISWGGVYWQYLEDLGKITPHTGNPLEIKKTLYTKVNTTKGPCLKPVHGVVHVGDELVVRLELRVDRDMEYIHLKDQRGSGTEPVDVLSEYKYQDGLGYYESTRDTASHFFIDHLSKGTYVFEYSTRVQLKGVYQSGMADIECMYAPEFKSHSESFAITAE